MGKSVVEQKLLEYPDVFADVYNAYCFGGESILKEEELEPMMAVAYTRNVDNEVRGRLRDVRKKCLLFSGRYPVICQIENQTDIDNTMPVRIMGYEYAAYEEQIDKYQDENKKNLRDAGSRKLFADQKLAPVITLVLNFGDQSWRKPTCTYDMVEWPEDILEHLKQCVVNYPIRVVDVAHLNEDLRKVLKSDFRIVAEYLACKGNIEKWEEFLKENHPIRHVEALLDVLGALSKNEMYYALLESIQKKEIEKEDWNMCYVIDEYMRRGMEKGIEKGMEKGMEQSLEIMKILRDRVHNGDEINTTLQNVAAQFGISEEIAAKYYSLLFGN